MTDVRFGDRQAKKNYQGYLTDAIATAAHNNGRWTNKRKFFVKRELRKEQFQNRSRQSCILKQGKHCHNVTCSSDVIVVMMVNLMR